MPMVIGIEPMIVCMYVTLAFTFSFIFGLQVGEKLANRYIYVPPQEAPMETWTFPEEYTKKRLCTVQIPISHPRIHIQPWGNEKFSRKLDYWEQQLGC